MRNNFEDLLRLVAGKTIEQAERKLQQYGWQLVREVVVDGQNLPMTAEFIPNRLNVSLKRGLIDKVVSIG